MDKNIKSLHKSFLEYVENYHHVKRIHAKLKKKKIDNKPSKHIIKIAKHLDAITKIVQKGKK